MKKNILFLCTGNSCRSQMAEGWGKNLKGDSYNFYSAGIKKHGLNPKAAQVMREIGIDISEHTSNTIDELSQIKMDYIITVCSDADKNCPHFIGGKVIHVGFDDPPTLTKDFDDEEKTLNVYRRVRDEIKKMVLDIDELIS